MPKPLPGKKRPEPPAPAPEPEPEPLPLTPPQGPAAPTFTEIGGSPVPGFTLRQVLRGHTAWIGRIAWSPDGSFLASPSADGTVRLWDVHTGVCVHTLRGHTKGVVGAAWSLDGRRLASAGDDKTIRLWDAASGKELQTLEGHTDQVNSVAWSPDGQRLASAADDHTIRLWDAASGRPLQTLEGHTISVNSVAWSPDGQRLASASFDSTIRLWDAAGGRPLQALEGHTARLCGVAWSPDGRRLASASADRTIRLWDAASGRPLQVLEGHSGVVNCAVFSPDGRWLASKDSSIGDEGYTVRLWRGDTGACVAVLEEPASHYWPPSIAFHPRAPVLATFGENETILRIWELDEALLLGRPPESVHYTTARVVLVGDSGVGKTGLGWRLAHGEFKEHASTHGQQFWVVKELGCRRSDGTECEAVLWDLAGQAIYGTVHPLFLENVDTALVLFDPTNRQDPLKGVQFWLEHLKGRSRLPPTLLVGARVDRGAPALSQQELEQFCQRCGISGGYVGTSAKSGEGLEALLDALKAQIRWEQMTATVTTATFKRIKDHVLALKEKPDRAGVLVGPAELRAQLQAADPGWSFSDAEMLTAVGHLETHGYVAVLRSSAGEQHILLAPDLLVGLASSIVLLADKNPRELGAVSETELLQGRHPFEELQGLPAAEQQVLLDAAVLRFLEHNICFRETLGDDTLLVFPGLIKQKRPLQDDLPAADDVSYVVRGRVKNLYAKLVVLLGYTSSFTRINQWQNQAQYEMGPGQVCGFRLIEEREGEIELVLYYGDRMPTHGRAAFQELFERFLYQSEVEITRIPVVACPNGHRQERATVVKRAREGKAFVHCEECGAKTDLPSLDKSSALGIDATPWLQREETAARLRSAYEVALTTVKSYRRDRAAPRCYLSRLPGQAAWAEQLAHDLRDAGVYVVEKAAQVQPEDTVVVLDAPGYQPAFKAGAPALATDVPLVWARLRPKRHHLVSLTCAGPAGAHELKDCPSGDFGDETHYPVGLFDLVLTLYAIPFTVADFPRLRQSLHRQWEETAARPAPAAGRSTAPGAPAPDFPPEEAPETYHDFELHIAPDGHAVARSPEGDVPADILTAVPHPIELALRLVERRETDAGLLKDLGRQLYEWLFPSSIHAHLHQTEGAARARGAHVRLRLRIEADAIARLPLELLYRAEGDYFLATNPDTVLSRYLQVGRPPERARRPGEPLHLLAIVAAPKDLPPLNPDKWESLLAQALAKPLAAGRVQLHTVKRATRKEIRNALQQQKPDLIQFVGHGLYQDGVGRLALVEEGTGESWSVDEAGLAGLLRGSDDHLGLICLAACESARSDAPQGFRGLAPRLVQAGTPAVVAMQYEVRTESARVFFEEFYTALAAGRPVDWAVQSARNAVALEAGLDNREFAAPVLYMRAKDGMVL